MGVPILGISGLSKKNDIWMLTSWPGAKNCIKGEGGGSPQVWAMVSLVSLCLPVVRPCTQKCSNYALTNLLFGLCKFVWIINLLVNLFSLHPRALTCPSTPKVLRAKEHAPTPSPYVVFTFRFAIKSIKELGGALVESFLVITHGGRLFPKALLTTSSPTFLLNK
jgi:hypothetical protein